MRRSFVQVPILAGVTALAVAACTLLGAVAALVSSLDGPVAGAQLARADQADTALTATLTPKNSSATDAVAAERARTATEGAQRVLDEAAGAVPLATSVWRTTQTYLLDQGRDSAGTYLAAPPADLPIEIVAGTAPTDSGSPQHTSTGEPVLVVAVPHRLAEERDWNVGDRVALHPSSATEQRVEIEIAGMYEPGRSQTAWAPDLLRGQVHEPEFFLRSGARTIELHGPLLTSPDALSEALLPLSEVTVSGVPDLSGTTASDAAALRDRVGLVGALLAQEVGEAAEVAFDTDVDRVVAQVEARTAVTRGLVLMTGLVLLVIAATALRLVARFLVEQRADGLELLDARGASRGQLVRLTVVEAAGVALIVALASPPLAVGLAGLVTRLALPAGGANVVAGDVTDPAVWATCAGAAIALAALLVAPVLRPGGAAAREPAHRPGRAAALRAALLSSGGTVLLVVLAGVAVWQLATHRTPTSGGGADPVTVFAPALLLLAVALVTVRCLPLLARAGDRIAARSRRLVLPLAAWETGRRPDRAAGTVLLLTLSISVALGVPPTVATWYTSQVDQAELAAGAPARLADVSGGTLAASARIADATGGLPVSFEPVTDRPVTVLGEHGRGHSFRLLAVDDAAMLRGRVVDAQGPDGPARTWQDVGNLLEAGPQAPGQDAPGIEIPAGSVSLDARVTTRVEVTGTLFDSLGGRETATEEITGPVRIDLLLADERGARELRTLAAHEYKGEERFAEIPLRTGGEPLDRPLRLVGMTVTVRDKGESIPFVPDSSRIRVDVAGLGVTDESGAGTPLDLGAWQGRSIPAVSPTDPGSQAMSPLADAVETPTTGASLTLEHKLPGEQLQLFGTRFALAPAQDGVPFPGTTEGDRTAPVPAVVTSGLAEQEKVAIGDTLRLDGPAELPLVVVGTVGHLPGGDGEGIMVRRDAMETAQFAAGIPLTEPDEWWAAAAPGDIDRVAAALDGVGSLRTLIAERDAALSDPLTLAVPTALGLVAVAAVLLAGAGVAAGATSSLRMRRLEIARLQALGVPRRLLSRAVLAEYVLLGSVSLLGGAVCAAVLTLVLAPATAVGPDGGPPVPQAALVVPWGAMGVLGGAITAVVGLVVAGSVRAHVRRATADLMRLGTDR